MKNRRNIYYGILAISFIGVLMSVNLNIPTNMNGLIYLVVLMSATSLFQVTINKVKINFNSPIVFTGFLLFGISEALVLVITSVLLNLKKNKKTERINLSIIHLSWEEVPGQIIDVIMLSISIFVASIVYYLLGGNNLTHIITDGPVLTSVINALPSYMIPIIGYLLTHMIINGVLVLLYLKMVIGMDDLSDVIDEMKGSIPTLLLVDATGVLFAVSYISTNWVFTTLLIAPLAIAGFAMQLYYTLMDSHIKTSKAMTESLEAKDKYTSGHSSRVQKYSMLLGNKLNLAKKDLKRLEFASLMHDVGKIGVHDEVLNKKGRLSDLEFDEIKEHPSIGSKIIGNFDNILFDCSNIIKYHHYYFDGSGYPKPEEHEEVPFLSRIISVADALDAMTSDRPYRKALSLSIAIDEIKKNAGKQFDPVVSDVFIELCEDGAITQESIELLNAKTNIHNLYEVKHAERVQKVMTEVS